MVLGNLSPLHLPLAVDVCLAFLDIPVLCSILTKIVVAFPSHSVTKLGCHDSRRFHNAGLAWWCSTYRVPTVACSDDD
ncbi:hypothetical protein COCC4DRAFT_29286 [Bipolaris maydis ATCC 48331]|uniref:Uncharacterized protein n=2 Tax=Cochliobolus heterostrophus TaxID=5016 RepID=M2UAI9_COCH5|nr:uncharacterized protein COCC4DRAFT_29286 [Bipolaris maydis ATCC 48331]EMD95599.1 hypothetical protein COCHEDRAFT_1019297 [Bipolaris maydis C5]KAJ5030346.1 hypothetical protein J3E73DRAFT_276245 [Bipolaris maydis]ENI10461.1 hypothetical protein COCC4DRAFT_29286 [Bipolaris maydis ATCC 48331]KAJ5065353.1 hypothetical protein J3E74DRAFT_301496 [Bipolaris maydis]KAJ6200566.1 hypothetical protein J3E72DRAFT_297861 [Bipolaris maydis]